MKWAERGQPEGAGVGGVAGSAAETDSWWSVRAEDVAAGVADADSAAGAAADVGATENTARGDEAQQSRHQSDESKVAENSQKPNYLDQLQRLQAEFDNYRRRTREQQSESAKRAAMDLAEKLLPVVDACEAAQAAAQTAAPAAQVQPTGQAAPPNAADGFDETDQGFVKLAELLLATLAQEGLQPLRPVGDPFDPNIHEAILHAPPDAGETAATPGGTGNTGGPVVQEVVRTGYLWHDKLLRPAVVIVKG